jgi:hypothetical protein
LRIVAITSVPLMRRLPISKRAWELIRIGLAGTGNYLSNRDGAGTSGVVRNDAARSPVPELAVGDWTA